MVKLCRPLGACHVVKIKIHLHVHSHMLLLLQKYASTYNHPFPSPEPFKNILLLIRKRIAKNISVLTCEINAQVILVTTTCYIISRDECSKKKRYEEIKRGKCPEPRKKEKVRREVKIDKCPTVELGVQDTHLRGKKNKNIEHLILLKKFQKSKKSKYPLKRATSRIRLSPLLSPSSPYTIHSPHMHILI